MEVAERMEIDEAKAASNQTNTKRYGLRNTIQTNFSEDYAFEIVAKDDWTTMAVSLSTNAVKLYSHLTGQYLGEFKGHSSTMNQISFPRIIVSARVVFCLVRFNDQSLGHQVACISAGPSEEVFGFSFGGADGSLVAAVCKSQISTFLGLENNETDCMLGGIPHRRPDSGPLCCWPS